TPPPPPPRRRALSGCGPQGPAAKCEVILAPALRLKPAAQAPVADFNRRALFWGRMVYPPGQGKSGEHLMQLWRDYLEQFAESEGDVHKQIIVGSYHAVEVFASLSQTLDRDGRYRELINQRINYFREGRRRAAEFEDCLTNGTFSLYNQVNTLSHQFAADHPEAGKLIAEIDDQVRIRTHVADQVERSAAALQAIFPLLSLVTLVLDQDQTMTAAIRQVEQRFAAGSRAALTTWEQVVNALYRVVEMMQLFALLSDHDLRDQVNQIASRFQEEDQETDAPLKLRNGFCRLFELGHLVTTHLDGLL
ncbi:MAG TPA: hypothetical protein VE398_07165, partial [Acidobacteriota bacterium]|nr:hypothetical protein [Acidobacteriota bacterium]